VTPSQPPRLAMWLLKRFGFSRYTQSILGDLTESYQSRQSTLWYWRQVAIAIVGSRSRGVRGHIDQGITFFRISGGHMRKAMAFVLAILVDCLSSYCKPRRNSMFAQLRTSRSSIGTAWITTTAQCGLVRQWALLRQTSSLQCRFFVGNFFAFRGEVKEHRMLIAES